MRLPVTIPLCLATLVLASCASHESFRVRVLRPAPVDLGSHSLVALDRWTGEAPEAVADSFGAALRAARNPLTGNRDFDIIDRAGLDAMLDRVRQSGAEDWQQQTIAQLERWKSADLVVRGHVETHRYTEELHEQDVTDAEGNPHTALRRHGSATLQVTVEALQGPRQLPFDSVRLQAAYSAETHALDSEPAPIDPEPLLARARDDVVGQYLRRVLPHEDWETVMLFIDGDLPQLDIGNGYAKAGDWQRALQSFGEALAAAEGTLEELRYKALFNSGVAMLRTNRFSDAQEMLGDAYALHQDERILAELQRARQAEADHEALQNQARRTAAPR